MSTSSSSSSAVKASSSEPYFRTIGPSHGNNYLEAVVRYCLSKFPELVNWIKGKIPLNMIEFKVTYLNRKLVGRKAGTYQNPDGSIATVDQSAIGYREELVFEAKLANECTEEEAVEHLFPTSSKKEREANRQLVNRSAQTLLNMMTLLWPDKHIQLAMSQDIEIQDNIERQDIIGFWTRFVSREPVTLN